MNVSIQDLYLTFVLKMYLDIFSTPNRTLLPYPNAPLPFQTFPDPRLNVGSRFKFIVSSCITPNFPYKGPSHRQTIQGFDYLAQSFQEPAPAVEEVEANSTTPGDEVNATEEAIHVSRSSILPKFMLFLGDFIYADVPIYFGSTKDAYQRLYRRNYASPSFRRIYEHIRTCVYFIHNSPRSSQEVLAMLHVYDDHEVSI